MKYAKYLCYLIPLVILFLFFGPLNHKPRLETEPIEYVSEAEMLSLDNYLRGVGSSANPYVISSAKDLEVLRLLVNQGKSYDNAYFVQTADIDLSDTVWDSPIGNGESTPFNGFYDGGGHTVSGLDLRVQDCGGLFGCLGGVVCNLTVNGRIVSEGLAGGIAGKLTGKTALILNCYNQAAVEGATVGGIAGENNGALARCFNTGALKGAVTRELAGTDGGVLYQCALSQPQELVRANLCEVTTDDFASQRQAFAELSQQLQRANYWQQLAALLLGGKGTKQEPYEISSAEKLCVFRDMVNHGYSFSGEWVRQTADIDLANFANWEPIGLFGTADLFDGVYDGAGHKIQNLMIDGGNVGFFGQLSGTVMNLGIDSGVIRGSCIGGIASHGDGSDNLAILNCYNRAALYAFGRGGGIADNFMGGTIRNCVNYGALVSADGSGGVWLAEIASYAADIQHCAFLEKGQPSSEYLTYTDAAVCGSQEEAARFLNSDLKTLAAKTGYQNNDFCLWQADGAGAALSQDRAAYTRYFFFRELLWIEALTVIALALAWFYRRETPRQLLTRGKGYLKQVPWNQKAISALFAATMFLTLLGMLLGDSEVYRSIFWLDSNDTFMDFYNPMWTMQQGTISLHDFYNKHTGSYPPIARFLLLLLGNMIPRDVVAAGAFPARTRSMMLFVLLVFGTLLWICRMIDKKKQRGNWLLFLMVAFCSPMIYTIERGNVLLFAFALSLFFVCALDDPSRAGRHASCLALSLAAGIKIYPAVYGVLLAVKRRWKEAVDTLCWGLSVFLLPFLFTGGFASFRAFLGTLSVFVTSNQTTGRYWLINYTNILSEISEKIGLPAVPSGIVKISLLLLVVLLIGCAFAQKRFWKQVLSLTLILVLLPGTNVYYSAIFYCIPLVAAFQDTREDTSLFSRLLVISMCLALVPLQFLCGTYGLTQGDIQFFVGLMGLVMAALILADSMRTLAAPLRQKRVNRREA